MRIAHSHSTEWGPTRRVRGGSLRFKQLLEGTENSPNNYSLVLAEHGADFQSPRHRHNFDQLRVSLRGATNIDPKRSIDEGDIAYFPESTFYGPQSQEVVGAGSLAMVVQFGGPAGSGIMSRRQMDEGQRQLQASGEFVAGVYKRDPETQGRRNQDAYEAIWEHHNSKALTYPAPRFRDPLHFQVRGFEWEPAHGYPGASTRSLGQFTERNVAVSMLRLEANAQYRFPTEPQWRIVFVCRGSGSIEGMEDWREHSALEMRPSDGAHMRAHEETEAVVLHMPRF